MNLYILSDPNSKTECYKVGSHTGSLKKLISRYQTSIPKVKINYFVETNKAADIENKFKQLHIDSRIHNRSGSLSEWFEMPLDKIIVSMINLICKFKSDVMNETTILSFKGETSDSSDYSETSDESDHEPPILVIESESDSETSEESSDYNSETSEESSELVK